MIHEEKAEEVKVQPDPIQQESVTLVVDDVVHQLQEIKNGQAS